MSMPHRFFGPALVGGLFLASVPIFAGDINPPAGPITPTQRTYIRSLPYTISVPGSYVLAGNLTGVVGQTGITINSRSVTLDLAGHSLIGVTGTLHGVVVDSLSYDVTIRNGTISNWSSHGIFATLSPVVRVEGVNAVNNGGRGISVGIGSEISNCVAVGNVNEGIVTGARSTITNCAVYANLLGIVTGDGCALADCTSGLNVNAGFTTNRSSVSNCTADANNGDGFRLGTSTTCINSSATGNMQHGITTGSNATVVNCTASSNGTGAGGGFGISAGGNSRIQDCVANGNGAGSASINEGIGVGSGSMVVNCKADLNRGNGIRASLGCRVTGCHAVANGSGGTGAGIRADATDNVLDGNTVVGNDIGIHVTGANNLIIRNHARGNVPNFELVANNKVGVIVAAPNSGAISGSTGGAGVGSTDPWANISY